MLFFTGLNLKYFAIHKVAFGRNPKFILLRDKIYKPLRGKYDLYAHLYVCRGSGGAEGDI